MLAAIDLVFLTADLFVSGFAASLVLLALESGYDEKAHFLVTADAHVGDADCVGRPAAAQFQ